MTYLSKLKSAQSQNNSWLCVGLDPDPKMMPEKIGVFEFNRRIIDATRSLVCAYKPNLAFYEALGSEGLRALQKTVKHVPDDIPVIKADRPSLVRAMRNLIDNALKYGGNDLSAIEIGYEGDGNSHVFEVSDNGVGLGVEEVEKIFDPFERKSRSNEIEGSGLGLAIVREIAEHHGGKAWATPKREKGTAFFLSISKDL